MTHRQFAIRLARKAGSIIRSHFTLGMKKKWKSDRTPLTKADIKINALVLHAIKKEFPNHGVLSEEGSRLSRKSEFLWVCDPIDGTFPFSHGIPASTFSLALVQNGRSILGVVYDPFSDRLYVAEQGKGATLNTRAIHVSSNAKLENTVVCIEWWQRARHDLYPAVQAFQKRDATIFKIVSICYETMLVAAGEAVAAIFPGEAPWDCAAAKIIVEETGGRVTDLYGKDQRYDMPIKGFIASNGKIHQTLVRLIANHLQ